MDLNHNTTHTGSHQQPPPSSCGPKADKAKLAGKGADLLRTASSFGEGKSLGKYLGKAENYLRKYQNTHSTNTPHGGPGPANSSVPLGYPPTEAAHGYPPTDHAPHGHPATTVVPPAGGPNSDSPNTVPLGYPPIAYPNTVAASANLYPGGNGYAHGDPGPANTVPLGCPTTSAPHGYPPTDAPHGHPTTSAVPPAGGPNGDSATTVPLGNPPIAYPNTVAASANPYPGGNGYVGGGHGNSGSGLGDYLKKASRFLKKH
ncbi:hypothetical protein RHMOL_Rhmol12G0156300 [Rhododendron molle]|uniref:Uncharacterized protein n=1 Tax=Rhododendron molle TaxID=49168 RepID=A0ACC0LJR1_RHOML|nr:hypothetical protein RHMOL_Rhmol12G0156300 [Rhododendron molle]